MINKISDRGERERGDGEWFCGIKVHNNTAKWSFRHEQQMISCCYENKMHRRPFPITL